MTLTPSQLKQIRERCERFKAIKAMPREERKKLEYDEWYCPVEELELARDAISTDVPALLDEVERLQLENEERESMLALTREALATAQENMKKAELDASRLARELEEARRENEEIEQRRHWDSLTPAQRDEAIRKA